MLINMFYLSFSEKYLNLSRVFLFWKEDGGGTKKSLKKFTNVVQFLTDMTPLEPKPPPSWVCQIKNEALASALQCR